MTATRGPRGSGAGQPRVVVVGEALMDVVHRADGDSSEVPGGSPANVALTLGRLGRDVELVTSLGADERGATIRRWLEASAVTVVAGPADGPTSTATAVLDAAGSATYAFDIRWEPTEAAVSGASVVHTGSIAAVLAPGADAVEASFVRSRETSTLTFDPNARPSIVPDRGDALARVERLVALSDVVKVSDEDLAWFHPGADPLDVADAWLASGPAVVVVTAGADGVTALTAGGALHVPAVPVNVVDTVGAGDTFMGALIDGLIELDLVGAERRDGLRAIRPEELESVLRRCARAAAITVSRAGADPPDRAALDAVTDTAANLG
ncbi:carbohydrate kinase [Cellulomonas sp. NPDC057328]|uniref:carbohydrate kinase family protein n=1 Tax=Cellulomonas sp. NPDC057328 TaxID=3346101 RepID=UPI00362CCEF2